jgi:hypothetical protein
LEGADGHDQKRPVPVQGACARGDPQSAFSFGCHLSGFTEARTQPLRGLARAAQLFKSFIDCRRLAEVGGENRQELAKLRKKINTMMKLAKLAGASNGGSRMRTSASNNSSTFLT